MKNVAVYLTPTKNYDEHTENVIKIWIDNSLELGWNKDDIVLVNNFPFEYEGIKSLIVPDKNFCTFRPGSSKTISAAHLLSEGIFSGDGLWWVHDPDAFQLSPITEEEIRETLGSTDVGFTTYGWSPKWSMGSYFFKESAKDIFNSISDTIYAIQNEDERALVHLMENMVVNKNRVTTLNITYNVGKRHIGYNYNIAIKPIRVLHFRPYDNRNVRAFVRGQNELNTVMLPDRLLAIFRKYGIS